MLAVRLLLGVLFPSALVNAFADLGPVKGLDRRQPKAAKCVVPANDDGTDDAPAILKAFEECKSNECKSKGHIVFENTTYYGWRMRMRHGDTKVDPQLRSCNCGIYALRHYVNQVMQTTGLKNVKIDIKGTLVNTTYWLENSLPTGYQNQSTAWILGGKNPDVDGFGHSTFDGNGQTWYDLVRGESNYHRRPYALLIDGTEDSVFTGLRFVQAQMWTVTIMRPNRVLLQDIYVNNTSSNRNPARNTDGANTIFSDRIHFQQWTVQSGDDCIAAKANSTKILIDNVEFHKGQGVAIGSIGQYPGHFESSGNVTARNVVAYGSRYAGRINTWTGEQLWYPPNGGGAGLGYTKNLSWDNVTIYDPEQAPIYVMQCITYNRQQGNCSSSLFDISNISFTNFRGSVRGSRSAYLECSRAHGGCYNVRIENVDLAD
ncbi:Alpha-L-rhamnosidase rgxB, partial [Colletotrichum shisoi]